METPRSAGSESSPRRMFVSASSRKSSNKADSPLMTIKDYREKLGKTETELMEMHMKYKAKESENGELKQRLQFLSKQSSIIENSTENAAQSNPQMQDEIIKLKLQNQELQSTINDLKSQKQKSYQITAESSPFSVASSNATQKMEDIVGLFEKATKECDTLNDKIKEMEKEKKNLLDEINDLKKALKQQESDIPSIQIDQMDGILRENSALKQKVKELLDQNTKLQKENLELKSYCDTVKNSDNSEKAQLTERIRSLESMITDMKNNMQAEKDDEYQKPTQTEIDEKMEQLKKENTKLRDLTDQQNIEIQDMKAQIAQIDSMENEIHEKDVKIEELLKQLALPQEGSDSASLKSMLEKVTKENGKLKAELRVKNYSNAKTSPNIKAIDNDVMREKAVKYDHLITLYNEISNRYNSLFDKTRDYDDKTEIIIKLQKRVTQAEIDEQDFKRACYEYQQQISLLEKKLRELYALIRSYSIKYGIEFVEIPDYQLYLEQNSPEVETDPVTQQRILKLEADVRELQNKLKAKEDDNIQLKDVLNERDSQIKLLKDENSQLRDSFHYSPPSHNVVDDRAEIIELKRKIVTIYEERDKEKQEFRDLQDDFDKLKKENRNLNNENELLRQQNLELAKANKQINDENKPRNKDSDINEQTQEMEKFIAPNTKQDNKDMIVALRVQIENAQKSQFELEKLKSQNQKLEAKIKENNNEISAFKKMLSEKEMTILKLNDDLIKMRNTLLQKDENIRELNEELQKLKQKSISDSFSNDFSNLMDKIRERDATIGKCNDEIARMKNDFADQISKLKSLLADKENELEKLKNDKENQKLKDQIIKLKSSNDEKENENQKLKDQILKLKAAIEDKEKEIQKLNDQINKLKSLIDDKERMNQSLINQVAELNSSIAEKNAEIKSLRDQISSQQNKDYEKQISDLRNQLQQLKDQSADIDLKDQILQLQKENLELREQLSGTSPSSDKKSIVALRRQVSDLQRMLDDLNKSNNESMDKQNSSMLDLQRQNRILERKNIDLANENSNLKLMIERKTAVSTSVIQLRDTVMRNTKIMLDRLSAEHKQLIEEIH